MKAIDLFLERHGVDVGKAFGLLSLTGAVFAFYGMVGQLLIGRIYIDFSAPIGIVIGIGLWRHRSWSRTTLLVISWAVVILLSAMLIAIPFTGTANLHITVGSTVIRNPALWQAYTFAVLLAPVAWFTLAVLHSNRAKMEFTKLTELPEPAPGLAADHGTL